MSDRITADDVAELLTSTSMDPTMVCWNDTGEIEIVSGVLLSDISYVHYDREYTQIVTAADLRQSGDWDPDHPTEDDFTAFADYLNEEN